MFINQTGSPNAALLQANQVPTPSANALDDIAQRLDRLCKTVGMNADRSERVISRAFGAQPEPGANGKIREARTGIIGVILNHLDDLESYATAQSNALDRIDQIV